MARLTHPLLAALIATTLVVTASLSWAAWRLLDQQRAIDGQRVRDQLESGADAIAAVVHGKLAEAGERLSGWLADPALSSTPLQAAVMLMIAPDEVRVVSHDGLPFVPVTPRDPPLDESFSNIEALEFGANQLAVAATRYRAFARNNRNNNNNDHVRAGALLRLGRVLRKSGDFNGALAAYAQLAALGAVRTDGLPAELVGLHGQRAVLIARGDRDGERRLTAKLLAGLDGGRWLVTQGPAEFYREELRAIAKPESWRLAAALSDTWRDLDGRLTPRGQRVFSTDGQPILVVWRSGSSRTALLAASAEAFFTRPTASDIAWHLANPEGERIAGDTAVPAGAVARIIGNSEHPWTLRVWSASSESLAGAQNSRGILLAMTTAMLAFVWGATYFIARAIRREAEVARLQSDFVAAVSHEFRSPLTTVRQMAEMLESGRLPDQTRRQKYYGIIASEAARLQRLVETLLNFGRMEAGAERYRFVDIDAAALVREVVREIEPQAVEAGKHIELSGPEGAVRVRADPSALAVALRNLIDNAIKYSPNESTVEVQWRKEDHRAAICVLDRGVGIPRSEQKAIFRKFVRGRAAIEANIKGTGVGLSMVREIALAHGGEILVDSETRRGTAFTLMLPLHESGGSR